MNPGMMPCQIITGATKCTTLPPVASDLAMGRLGDMCDSNGGEVDWIVIARAGFVQFNTVTVPADGTYDLTWYYKCGNSDNYGDAHCGLLGGQTNPPNPPITPSGCRPHEIKVNGVPMTGTYHFPCYPGSWRETHVATTPVPLKGGIKNVIWIGPPARDSVNLDALWVLPHGKGLPPVITANNVPGSN
jgi:hypothetical protein